jgi:hypothetical protein
MKHIFGTSVGWVARVGTVWTSLNGQTRNKLSTEEYGYEKDLPYIWNRKDLNKIGGKS